MLSPSATNLTPFLINVSASRWLISFCVALGNAQSASTWSLARRRRQRILQHLFERQKRQNAQIHRPMKAQPALVRSDGGVHFDPEAAVHLHSADIIEPRHAEWNYALRPLAAPGFAHPEIPDASQALGAGS